MTETEAAQEGLRPGVAALLTAMTSGRPIDADALAPEVVLDATVPNWRMSIRGRTSVTRQLAGFYGHPGQLEDVQRWTVPGGEVVEITLNWVEDGVAHTAHQSHRLELDAEGRIDRDTMFCGGRWPAELRAQMEAADVAR